MKKIYKKTKRNVIIGYVLAMFILMFSISASASEPEYEVNISPENPVSGSEITFSIILENYSNINGVYLNYQECSDNLCFNDYNMSLTATDEGSYEKEVDLQKTQATYVSYWIVINSNDSWYTSGEVKIDLEEYEDASGDGGNEENSTPGFEMILLISTLLMSLVVIRRVRKK